MRSKSYPWGIIKSAPSACPTWPLASDGAPTVSICVLVYECLSCCCCWLLIFLQVHIFHPHQSSHCAKLWDMYEGDTTCPTSPNFLLYPSPEQSAIISLSFSFLTSLWSCCRELNCPRLLVRYILLLWCSLMFLFIQSYIGELSAPLYSRANDPRSYLNGLSKDVVFALILEVEVHMAGSQKGRWRSDGEKDKLISTSTCWSPQEKPEACISSFCYWPRWDEYRIEAGFLVIKLNTHPWAGNQRSQSRIQGQREQLQPLLWVGMLVTMDMS